MFYERERGQGRLAVASNRWPSAPCFGVSHRGGSPKDWATAALLGPSAAPGALIQTPQAIIIMTLVDQGEPLAYNFETGTIEDDPLHSRDVVYGEWEAGVVIDGEFGEFLNFRSPSRNSNTPTTFLWLAFHQPNEIPRRYRRSRQASRPHGLRLAAERDALGLQARVLGGDVVGVKLRQRMPSPAILRDAAFGGSSG